MSGRHCPSPPPLAEEASKQVAGGYHAVKLRPGDTLKRYIERTVALRSALGSDVALQADANCRSHYVSGKNNVVTRVTTVSAADAVHAVAVFSTATPMPTEHAVISTLPDEEGGTAEQCLRQRPRLRHADPTNDPGSDVTTMVSC
jgi:hypothetical protein